MILDAMMNLSCPLLSPHLSHSPPLPRGLGVLVLWAAEGNLVAERDSEPRKKRLVAERSRNKRPLGGLRSATSFLAEPPQRPLLAGYLAVSLAEYMEDNKTEPKRDLLPSLLPLPPPPPASPRHKQWTWRQQS